jgi:fatty acid desaturase
MPKIQEVSDEASKKVMGVLSGRPIWVYWIMFTLMIGVVFGIGYGVMYLLSFRWWILALVIVVAGMASGTFAYLNTLKKSES